MARLILSLDNQVLAEYNMTKERYTIGRLPDNDVRIDNPAVSGHHSLIINILNDSFLEDLNSTNGTYVNGKLIKKHALQHGDVITIGHHQLRFSDQQAPETEQDEFEKTMVIPTGQQNADQLAKAEAAADRAAAAAATEPEPVPDIASAVKLDPEEAAGLDTSEPEPAPEPQRDMAERVSSATATGVDHSETVTGIDPEHAPSALPLAKLQVLSGAFAGRELELTKALTTLGRPGVQVAAITRRAEGYYIVHVESGKEGDFPLVNGKPIGAQARKLTDNDVVQLAGVKMGFFAA
ncbi:MAG: FHA domain-containing protein [Woeseiaceae bacterium]|jgi:predicted component of type VI protein secretion system